MWIIKVLNGPEAGLTSTLANGRYKIGRGSHCQIVLTANGISKEHATLSVKNGELTISDLKSTNGVFANGSKIKNYVCKAGDIVYVFNIKIAIQTLSNIQSLVLSQNTDEVFKYPVQQNLQQTNSTSFQETPQDQAVPQKKEKKDFGEKLNKLFTDFNSFVEENILVHFYEILNFSSFKGLFLMSFFAAITLSAFLSVFPIQNEIQSSILAEGKQRALSIARALAHLNEKPLSLGQSASLSVNFAKAEPGVQSAYLISTADTSVLAPASQSGGFAKSSFANMAAKIHNEHTEILGSNKIGASVPITLYNPTLGRNSAEAIAVVTYKPLSSMSSFSKIISIGLQNFILFFIFCSAIFFLLFKLISKVFSQINEQVEAAIKNKNSVETAFEFPPLSNLIRNINTCILNQADDSEGQEAAVYYDRTDEYQSLMSIIAYPCLIVSDSDQAVLDLNPDFESLLGLERAALISKKIAQFDDEVFKTTLSELISIAKKVPGQLHSINMEFDGVNHSVNAQAIYGKSEVAYFVITISPLCNEDEDNPSEEGVA